MVENRRAAALALVAALGLGGLAGCAPGAAGDGSQGSAAGSASGSAATEGSAPAGGSAPVEAPAEPEEAPAEPVSQHDYETEWFYVDVPDTWTYSEDGEASTWYVEGPVDNGDGTMQYQFHVTGPNIGMDGNAGGETVIVGGPWQDYYTTNVGTAPDGTGIYLMGAGASFFATDGYFEGDTFVSVANGVTDPNYATITLKTAEAEAATSQPADDAQAAFVATARAALGVPDDPSITFFIGEPTYWEGAGAYTTVIQFYQGDTIVASANCWDDGTPARNILAYTAPE